MSLEREEILRLRDRVHSLEGALSGVKLLADAVLELREGQEGLARRTADAIHEKAAELHEENEALDKRVRSLESGLAAIGANVKLSIAILLAMFSVVGGIFVTVLLHH